MTRPEADWALSMPGFLLDRQSAFKQRVTCSKACCSVVKQVAGFAAGAYLVEWWPGAIAAVVKIAER